MKVILREQWNRAGFGIWLVDEKPDGTTFVVKPANLEVERKDAGAFPMPDPTFLVPRESFKPLFQSMLDELVRIGFRADSDRTAGELEATKKHVADLKEISSKLLGILEGR